jgi:general secretion pathway protein D
LKAKTKLDSEGTAPMKLWKHAAAAALCLVLVGCAGADQFRKAQDEEQLGHWDLAVIEYGKAVDLAPSATGYRTALARAKLKASQVHFEKGKMYRASGRPDLAVIELEQTVLLDPTNDYAAVELKKAQDEAAKREAERSADSNMVKIKKKTRGARAVMPILEPSSDKPINLNFPQPKPIKQIYRALADAAGINVVFDPQMKDDNVSIVLTQIDFLKALETLVRQENHFYKIIDERTILIAADTPQNRKTYEDLVIRTFFLSNADVTEVANALRALLQTTRISVNKAENSITLRDTSDKVAVAERIVEQNDKQVAEVVVDVELLQINSEKAQTLGIELSQYSIFAGVPAPGGTTNLGAPLPANQFNWAQLQQLSINSFGFTIPSATLNFLKSNTDAELLAKPQLRIAEGQKAQLLIGDKVPIPVTTFQTVSSGTTLTSPATSFQYQDIGIKIEVEPRVHHNKEVTLKLMTEVSNINGIVTNGGLEQPIIGTRTISANIRLKDGETNFLAGLYRRDRQITKKIIPFIGDIPILGKLFTNDDRSSKTTDLVLTLTPHIIRIPDVTEEDIMPVYVGTDANISYQGSPRVENPSRDAGPFEQPPPSGRPGGRPQPAQAPGTQPAPQPAPGTIPAPGGLPSDIFRPPPQPTPPPPTSPREAVPPQASATSKNEVATSGDPNASVSIVSANPSSSDGVSANGQVLLDFDPAYLALAPGQQQSVLVRATSASGFPGGTITVGFDPAVAAVVVAKPIMGSGSGVAEANIRDNQVVIQIPSSPDLTGTRAVAEITLRGIAAGRATLTLAPTDMNAVVTTSQSVVDVR